MPALISGVKPTDPQAADWSQSCLATTAPAFTLFALADPSPLPWLCTRAGLRAARMRGNTDRVVLGTAAALFLMVAFANIGGSGPGSIRVPSGNAAPATAELEGRPVMGVAAPVPTALNPARQSRLGDGCRYVYVDLGSNIGVGVRKL